MDKEFWTIEEVASVLQTDRQFLEVLEREEIICPVCTEEEAGKRLTREELHKAYLARFLIEELDVNLPGVEVILRLRQNLLEMRQQFDRILDDLAGEIKRRFLIGRTGGFFARYSCAFIREDIARFDVEAHAGQDACQKREFERIVERKNSTLRFTRFVPLHKQFDGMFV